MGHRLLAIVAEGQRGRVYLEATPEQEELANSKAPDWIPETPLPHDPRNFWTVDYGIRTFGDLFSKRQLVALNTFSNLVTDIRRQVEKDAALKGLNTKDTGLSDGGKGAKAYAEAICIYLAFLINQIANHSTTICGWNSVNTQMRSTFARQSLPMSWDYAECNIFSNSSGSFNSLFTRMIKGFTTLGVGSADSKITQSDAQTIQYDSSCVFSTDPPYYDNIGYADLSDFFYIWLKRNLKDTFPNLTSTITVPKTDELVATPYRHGSKDAAEVFFLDGMKKAISSMASQGSDEYPATIYYAFKQSEIDQEGLASTGWATFIQAIIDAGYSIVATWPVRTEKPGRTIAIGTNALATSVVLVCRKREIDAESVTRAEFIRALKRELPSAILELQKANITPVDMPQASIGPGIGIFSRYKLVLESDDSPMSVRTALQIINKELDEFLTEQESEYDPETRFSVTWFEQNGIKAGNFGDADNLARARGLSVDSVKHAGIVESAAGKVRLLAREELDGDWTPANDKHLTVWECTQYLIRTLHDKGEYAAAILLKQMGADMADGARDLA